MTDEQRARLDAASEVVPPYPYYPYHNGQFAERNPPLVASLNPGGSSSHPRSG